MPDIDFIEEIDFQEDAPAIDFKEAPVAAKDNSALSAEAAKLREKDEGATKAKVLGHLEGIAGKIANPIGAVLDLPEQLWRSLGHNIPYSARAPLVTPESAKTGIESITPGGGASEGSAAQAAQEFAAEFASGMTTPDMIGALIAGTKFPLPVGRYFQGQMISRVPESAKATIEAETGKDQTKAALATAANIAFPALIERGINRPAAKESKPKPPDPDWQVTVQKPMALPNGEVVPGYTQIDFIEAGKNTRSTNPEALRNEGYAVPDLSNVPQGRHSMADVMEWIKQPVGIVPEGTALVQKAIEFLTPRKPGAVPPVKLEANTPAPRLQPYEDLKKIVSEPHGAGKVPVAGKLIDPRYSAKSAADEAIIANAHSRFVGDTIASIWFEQSKNRPAPFRVNEAGALETGGHLSDIIEAEMRQPGSQNLTAEQRAWINEVWKPVYEKTTTMLREEGVKEFDLEANEFTSGDGAYFPRIAIGKIKVDPQKVSTGSASVGGKQFFQKKRLYETEAEGAKTTIYEPDPNKRIATYLTRTYKAIADTRLANDKSLGGRTVKERFDAIKAERSGILDGLDAREVAAIEAEWHQEASRPLFQKEGQVYQPAFRGVIFPIETANRLNKAFGEQSHGWVKTVNAISNVSKAAQLTLDFSAPLTQGLPMLFRHPVLWARTTVKSFEALLRPDVIAKELGRPEIHQAASELAQMGVSIRQLQDYMAGAAKGEFLTKIPVYGKAVEATGRSFGAFNDLAKIELWRAYRELHPDKAEWPKIAETIENMLLAGRSEVIGIHPGRAIGERLLLLAPAYYRGAVGLVSTAFQKGASGKIARQALTHFAAGLTTTMVGAYIASGFNREEILARLNPASSKFLKYPVTLSNGKVLEVGLGGILLSMTRLLGDSVEAIIDDRPVNTGVEGNLWLRWLRAKAAPIPSFVADATTGRDFMGEEITLKEAAGRRALPITVQQVVTAKDGTTVAAADAVPSFFGMQAHGESTRQTQMRERNDLARQKFNKGYDGLSVSQQARINREVQQQERFAVREPSTLRKRELATKADFEREQRLLSGISIDNQKKLKAMGLNITSYDPVIRRGGVKFPMSDKQRDAYEAALIAEYNKVLDKIGQDSWKTLSVERKQKLLNAHLLAAKERAKRVIR